jgi:hypothetical protein
MADGTLALAGYTFIFYLQKAVIREHPLLVENEHSDCRNWCHIAAGLKLV